jgi:ribosomal protein S20
MPIPAGAIMSAGIQGINSLLGRRQQIKDRNRMFEHDKNMADRAFGHDMEMTKYAYDKDLEMWNLQNEYNSPLNQRKRYEEAGLNPNLMYGQGTTGNASSMPTHNIAKYQNVKADYKGIDPIQIPDAIQRFTDLSLKQTQTNKMRDEALKTRVETGIKEVEKNIAESTQSDEIKRRQFRALNEVKKNQIQAGILQLQDATKDRINANTKLTNEQRKWAEQRLNEWTNNRVNINDSGVFGIPARVIMPYLYQFFKHLEGIDMGQMWEKPNQNK